MRTRVSTHAPRRAQHDPDRRRLLKPTIGLAISWLMAVLLLGSLLGSLADPPTAFAEHFDDGASRGRDLAGSFALLVAAAMLAWTVVAVRQETGDHAGGTLRDLAASAGLITAAMLGVASAALMAVPLTISIGELTDDPGIDNAMQAGIAQAGIVMLLVAALGLAVTVVLVAHLARQARAVPRWFQAASWAIAVTLCLGMTVVLLIPAAGWAIALGMAWRRPPSPESPDAPVGAMNAQTGTRSSKQGEPR